VTTGTLPAEATDNARDLEAELAWFADCLDQRFKRYFHLEGAPASDALPDPPPFSEPFSPYAALVRHHRFDAAERLALALALAPHLRPQLLQVFHTRNQSFDCRFGEFGGMRSGPEGDFWPTGETLAFLLGGSDLKTRFAVRRLLEPDHPFGREGLLRPVPTTANEPPMKAPLRLAADCLDLVMLGAPGRPAFGPGFPARRIATSLAWDDLVLHPVTRRDLEEIMTWIRHGETLMTGWGMARKLRPGYRALFHGPPGTGKTMTACLLGQAAGRDVYRIDLALVVSKYIGETEKNLATVFDQAQNRGWILFFDEADALFGKRSETRDAHDRYANQEVAFLLQRIESFDGIAILASNLRDNIDAAFARRFESIVFFPMPRPEERLELWRQGFSPQARFAPDLDLAEIARDHALSGGAIINAVRHASLQALDDGNRPIARPHLIQSIRRELAKEGKLA
jgi:hypothetical protein